jgi:hypothetical protein
MMWLKIVRMLIRRQPLVGVPGRPHIEQVGKDHLAGVGLREPTHG